MHGEQLGHLQRLDVARPGTHGGRATQDHVEPAGVVGSSDQQEPLGTGREPSVPVDVEALDPVRQRKIPRQRRLPGELFWAQRPRHLHQSERVPARLRAQPIGDLNGDRSPGPVGKQVADGFPLEALDPQLGQVIDLETPYVAFASSEHERNRFRLQAPSHEEEGRCGRVV